MQARMGYRTLASHLIILLLVIALLFSLKSLSALAQNIAMLHSSRTLSAGILQGKLSDILPSSSMEVSVDINHTDLLVRHLETVFPQISRPFHIDTTEGRDLLAQIILQWGHTLQQSGEISKAFEMYKLASLIRPNWSAPKYYQAVIFEEQGVVSAAIASYEDAIAASEFTTIFKGDIYLRLGELHRRLGAHEKAREYLQKAVGERFVNSSRESQAWYLLGMEEWATQRDLELVRQRFVRSLAFNPNHYWSLYTLGRLAIATGDFQNGEEILYKAMRVNPEEIASYELLMKHLYDQGKFDPICKLISRLPNNNRSTILKLKYSSICQN